jgi:superfamily II DNA or RNA helicase/DNA-directed RNA polymerase subunit RPC12/RpoP
MTQAATRPDSSQEKSMMLWDYQQEALGKLTDNFKVNATALLVMATGLGKTMVAAHWAQSVTVPRVTRGLFLCHETEILEQANCQFRQVLGESVSFGVFHGGAKTFDSVDWLFATFQTMLEWKTAFLPDEFDYLIVDESHHSQASTFRETIAYFKPLKMLGMTATPDRMDERDIREIFGPEVVNILLAQAIAEGWLTRVEYRLIADNLNRSSLKRLFQELIASTKKRVSIKQLNESLFIDRRDDEIAGIILAENKKTIIFCENIEHCNNFARFIPGGYAYHAGCHPKDNAAALKRFKNDDLQYVLAVNKFNEGVDIPNAELIVFLRATDSATIFWQQLGRGLRKTPGKEKVIIMDFVANCDRLLAVKDLAEQIETFANDELVKGVFHIEGSNFEFIFTRDDIDILDIIERSTHRRHIADIPHLAAEYLAPPDNELSAAQVGLGANIKVNWRCSKEGCRHLWQASVPSRVGGHGCPACARQLATASNNLTVSHPMLALEYLPVPRNHLPANGMLAGSDKMVWWRCAKEACGHEWSASVHARTGGNGCPSCAGRVATATNNLTVTHPHLALDYMPSPRNEKPAAQVIAGTRKKIWWKCAKVSCGHEFLASGDNRVRGTNCPACSGRVVTVSNNLNTTHPYLALEYMAPPRNALPVELILAGTAKKIWWKCSVPECGQEFLASGTNRARGGNCPKWRDHQDNVRIPQPADPGHRSPIASAADRRTFIRKVL